MTPGSGQRPSPDQSNQFLQSLADILPGIGPMPPEVMIRLGRDLRDALPPFSAPPVAEPPTFVRMAIMLAKDTKPTMKELSEALSLPISTVSRMVSQLEERGYAERLPDAADGRVVRVRLTDTARQLYETVCSHAARNAESLLNCLTPEERIILLTLLAKVASNSNRDER